MKVSIETTRGLPELQELNCIIKSIKEGRKKGQILAQDKGVITWEVA